MSASTVSSYDGERRKPKGAVLFTGTRNHNMAKLGSEPEWSHTIQLEVSCQTSENIPSMPMKHI